MRTEDGLFQCESCGGRTYWDKRHLHNYAKTLNIN